MPLLVGLVIGYRFDITYVYWLCGLVNLWNFSSITHIRCCSKLKLIKKESWSLIQSFVLCKVEATWKRKSLHKWFRWLFQPNRHDKKLWGTESSHNAWIETERDWLGLGFRISVGIWIGFFGFLYFWVYVSRSHTKILLVQIGFG